MWWVGWEGEGMKISGGSPRRGPQPDFWWQLYLLTPTSGDADTNPARPAPFSLEVQQSAAVRCASRSEEQEFRGGGNLPLCVFRPPAECLH